MFLCLLDIIIMQSKHYEFIAAMSPEHNMHASYVQSAFNFTRVGQSNTTFVSFQVCLNLFRLYCVAVFIHCNFRLICARTILLHLHNGNCYPLKILAHFKEIKEGDVIMTFLSFIYYII